MTPGERQPRYSGDTLNFLLGWTLFWFGLALLLGFTARKWWVLLVAIFMVGRLWWKGV